MTDQAASEISPLDFARALERGEAMQVVDVRAPARVAQGRIDLVPDARFHNIRGSELITYASLDRTGIEASQPVTVVCGHGNDSRKLATHLSQLGARARSLRGGLAAWMRLTLPRDLPVPSGLDALLQFDRIGKGALGYLLVSDGEALIVDPPRDAAAYLEEAAARGARIVAVADTHVHADYISGAPDLSARLGVPYCLHPADAVYPYDGTPGRLTIRPLAGGEAIHVGRCTLRVGHTPGHTEGSVTYFIGDEAAFTGDFLFVASIGRPDLAGRTQEWTAALWNSVERARRDWAPAMRIYPAHYGSESERNADRSVGAAFSRLLETNPALGLQTDAAFAAWVEGRTTSFPEAYKKIKAVNVRLVEVDDREAEELEVGRNECALSR